MIGAGELREVLTIHTVVTVRGKAGGQDKERTGSFKVFGKRKSVKPEVRFIAGQDQSVIDVEFIVRFDDRIDGNKQVEHQGQFYEIVSEPDVLGNREGLRLLCRIVKQKGPA